MVSFIITTGIKTTERHIQKAKKLAAQLNVEYIERNKRTLSQMLNEYSEVLVVYKDKLSYSHCNGKQFEFHPSMSYLRTLSKRDPLLEAVGSDVSTVIDATMGLASDSIVLSYHGYQVTAVEASSIIYTIVSSGLQTCVTERDSFNEAMRKIQTIYKDCLDYLKSLPDNAVDAIYFDPMFTETVLSSTYLDGIRHLASYDTLSEELYSESMRVAKKRLIIKAHFRDTVFEKYGFTRYVRKNTKFHFGVKELS